ncbi:hypothetical protein I553_5245 [Mycobacterium xenopi 4042]|uniref:Uncharacterized protein n=1 Tax=Mycobacterium xenopi 4042 TaxID=1299334 RepID=X7ZWB8_MYCXE|nr:hypothetical protein I553_5245 [Mycobacterium xenopi 4042]
MILKLTALSTQRQRNGLPTLITRIWLMKFGPAFTSALPGD